MFGSWGLRLGLDPRRGNVGWPCRADQLIFVRRDTFFGESFWYLTEIDLRFLSSLSFADSIY
jgi:hypothetical protein